ncbi:MAG: ribonuclease [Micavibrio sp.]|nr:ribonuclease [Micavibrio sp.]
MASDPPPYPRLTKASLYQLIAMHRNPVSRDSALQIFGSHRDQRMSALLRQLENENKIKQSAHGYRALQPWADIALATLGPVSTEKRAKLTILNLPEDLKVEVSITRSDVYKHSLKQGDRIAVHLARGQSGVNALRARFIAHADDGKSLALTGNFNKVSRLFTTQNYNLKTEFKLAREPDGDAHHLLVELTPGFDMCNPVLSPVADQTLDPASGEEIVWIIARKHEIALSHPQNIIDEAAILARKPVSLDHRVDLRALDFITVDPLGAQDLDDAMCARVEKNGYAKYTAIADVPYFLPYGNIVDRHAYQRGLTHYLADDQVAHMLPSVLSTNRCSLVPQQDRPVIVVKQILGWDFELKGFEIFAAVINSHEQLSYGQFYDKLDRKDPRFIIMAQIHDERRRKGLDKSQQSFLSNSPDKYSTKSIVETAMVQTNSLAAQFLSEANMPYLSRNYAQNPQGQLRKNGNAPRAFYAVVSMGHAQIGLRRYAHISSPIRRYGDNIDIRAIHKVLKTPGLGIDDHQVANLAHDAAHLNGRRDTDDKMTTEIQKYHSLAQARNLGLIP